MRRFCDFCILFFQAWISLSLLAFSPASDAASPFSDSQIEEIVKGSSENGIYTTHSETTRPIHVPVYQRYPINVPHPVPIAVPQYVRVPIPQPYPKYTQIEHKIEIPVYKIVPEIIEKPIPYTVEKPYPGWYEICVMRFTVIQFNHYSRG